MKKWKRKTKWMGLLLSLCMMLSIVPITAFADSPSTSDGGGAPVNVRTVDNSVDASSICVSPKVLLRDKETGEETPMDIDKITPENVTVGTFDTIKTSAIEQAKTMLNECFEESCKLNPDVQFTVVGDMVVEGNDESFDNRVYTMRTMDNNDDDIIIGDGDEASDSTTSGNQTTSRYMQIDGDYGKKGNYSVTMTVEAQAVGDIPSNPSEIHSVNFGSGNWTVGEQTVTANKNGTQDLAMDDVITLTGFDVDTMQVKLVAEDGFSTTLSVIDGKTSLSAKNCDGLPSDGTLTFSVVEKGEPGPGPEPGPGQGDEPAHGGYEGEEKTASVTVTGKADFYINDSRMVNANNGDSFDDIEYHYDGNGSVDFYFNCFISERITALKINGVDYYNTLPNPSTEEGKAALLDACKGQLNEFKITVPYSESGYTIDSNVKWLDDSDKDYMVVGNFLWTYEDENQGDDYIDHGRMELIGVNYNGRDYSPSDLSNPGTAKDWGQDESGGSAVLPVGAVVTVKLIPDYGYQLTSFGINGGNFGTGDEQSVFTFEIKPGNAHLGARFTAVEDKVASSSDKVKDGTIELGGEEIDSGSVVLSVDDVALSNEQIANFEETASGYEISSYLDINLDQVVYKGTADDVWTKELKELNNEATLTLVLENDVNGNEVVIVHEKHDGTYEIIPTVYNPETNTITFKTSSFSNYAIASKVASGQATPTEENKTDTATPTSGKNITSPQTGDNSNLALWFAVLFVSGAGLLGTTVYSKRKKRME